MKLDISKELIEIVFNEEEFEEEIEIEQEFDGPKVYRSVQQKVESLLNTLPKMKEYMNKNNYTTLESSGYVLSLVNLKTNVLLISLSFTIFKDDEDWTNEDLSFNVSFDGNLNIITMDVRRFFENKYLFKM